MNTLFANASKTFLFIFLSSCLTTSSFATRQEPSLLADFQALAEAAAERSAIETEPEVIRVADEQIEIEPEGLRVADEQIEIEPEGLRMADEQIEIEPEGLRVADEQIEIEPEGLRVVRA